MRIIFYKRVVYDVSKTLRSGHVDFGDGKVISWECFGDFY